MGAYPFQDPSDPLFRLSRLAAVPVNRAAVPNLVPSLTRPLVAVPPSGDFSGPRLVPPSTNAAGASMPRIVSTGGPAPVLQTPDLGGNQVPELGAAPRANVVQPASAPATRLGVDQAELQRLQHGDGISSIQNPWARGFARAGDLALSMLAPNLAALTPGTRLHNLQLQSQATKRIGEDQGELESASKLAEQQAQTALLDAQPQLKQSALELQQTKLDNQQQHYADSYRANLAKIGLAPDETDPNGQSTRPLRYEEMSPLQQGKVDLDHSNEELKAASSAYEKAKAANLPVQMQLAQQRIAGAAQARSIALQRLGLSRDQFNAREYGTGPDGQPLPGAMLLPDGTSVGSANAANVRPTSTQRSKADLAQSALERVHEMQEIVSRRGDVFGPVAGRATNAQAWLGSSDPDAATYQAAAQYLADHSAGVFGGRGQYIMGQLHGLTDPKYNPAALQATLSEAERAAQGFAQAGTMHTAGGPGTSRPSNQSGNRGQQSLAPGGGAEQIPASAAALLQEGVVHTFGNGQAWSKQNGKPVRVK